MPPPGNLANAGIYVADNTLFDIRLIGVTGYSGGKVRELADYSLHVNIDDTQITEDGHMIFDHMLVRVMGRCGK